MPSDDSRNSSTVTRHGTRALPSARLVEFANLHHIRQDRPNRQNTSKVPCPQEPRLALASSSKSDAATLEECTTDWMLPCTQSIIAMTNRLVKSVPGEFVRGEYSVGVVQTNSRASE